MNSANVAAVLNTIVNSYDTPRWVSLVVNLNPCAKPTRQYVEQITM